MTGSEHSKKPKTITIDVEPEAVPAQDMDYTNTATPAAPQSSGGFTGRIGAGIVGGIIALTGGAGLQYAGQLPSFSNTVDVSSLQADVAKRTAAPAFNPAVLDIFRSAQTDLTSQVAALSSEIAQLKLVKPVSGGDAVQALKARLAALESAVTRLPTNVFDPGSSIAFKALSDKVAALEAAPKDTGSVKSVAIAIAASGLKAAIDRGGSFMNELEAYASVAPASPDVVELRTLAAKGVPSSQDLLAGFEDAANAMINAAVMPDPDMGIVQRLTESAKGLVKARRVGDIQGDEPDAVLARMEVALQRGELASVLAMSEKLPERSKAVGKQFLDKVTARRDTDTLVSRALGLALVQAGGKS
jgi:hypothetical protein